MPDKNASKETPQATEDKKSSAFMFKLLLAVIILSVLTVILKSAGAF